MASKNEQAVRASHQGFNDRDWDAMRSLVADDCVFVDGRGISHKGPDAFANDYSKGWADSFSDGKVVGGQAHFDMYGMLVQLGHAEAPPS